MRISIERRGGVMGGLWSARVTDDTVSVARNGRPLVSRFLSDSERAELDRVVEAALHAPQPKRAPGGAVPDGMQTEVSVHHGSRRRRLRLQSGAKAGPEVLELIRTVREVAGRSE